MDPCQGGMHEEAHGEADHSSNHSQISATFFPVLINKHELWKPGYIYYTPAGMWNNFKYVKQAALLITVFYRLGIFHSEHMWQRRFNNFPSIQLVEKYSY